MRLSQPKGEAAEFAVIFETSVKSIHPDYKRNKSVRGVRSEYIRELYPGLYASHNAFCKKGTYYHGFCITLHQELPTPYLHSPFTAGGRFDHNYSINKAIQRDLGAHMILSDSHQFRKGCEGIITRCTSEAEQILLPHYMKIFNNTKNALKALAELVLSDVSIPDPQETIRGLGRAIVDLDCDMTKFSNMYNEQTSHDDFYCAIIASKPELFQRLRKNKSLNPSQIH